MVVASSGKQKRLDRWVEEFNLERPQEALAGATPASMYELSEREYPGDLEGPEYPAHYETRRVGSNGELKFRRVKVYVSQALANGLVGLIEVEEGQLRAKFGPLELATCDEHSNEMKAIGGSARAFSKGKKYNPRLSTMRPV